MQARDVGGVGEAAWSRYWAAGHAHSCPTSFQGFYGPQLQAFWTRQAASLGVDDVLLDLGCGNGALLSYLASQFEPGKGPRLVGVDAASVRPPWREGAPPARVEVHPGTPFQLLPLPAASVALAASMFGIEYGNEDATWRELCRVLRPRSRIAFVMHKQGSHLETLAADEIVVARAALAPDGALAVARALVPYLARAASDAGRAQLQDDRAAHATRDRFNAAAEALVSLAERVKHGGYAHDILAAVMRLLKDAGTGLEAIAGQRIDSLREGVDDHLARVEALRRCALDVAGLEAMGRRLEAEGFTVGTQTISEQGFEMGWALEASRG